MCVPTESGTTSPWEAMVTLTSMCHTRTDAGVDLQQLHNPGHHKGCLDATADVKMLYLRGGTPQDLQRGLNLLTVQRLPTSQ